MHAIHTSLIHTFSEVDVACPISDVRDPDRIEYSKALPACFRLRIIPALPEPRTHHHSSTNTPHGCGAIHLTTRARVVADGPLRRHEER